VTLATDILDLVTVVMVEPQDDINIGNTVRACKNFGVRTIRLVRPAHADPHRIGISAPRAQDVIEAITHHPTLDDALADCKIAIGTTARDRHIKRLVLEPRGAAHEAVEVASAGGRIAIVFGREDSGLPNDALERCNFLVTIPTDPDYSSLNLGQAVLLLVHEVFRAIHDTPAERPEFSYVRAEGEHPPADIEALELLLERLERTLTDIDFIKESSREHMRRSVREMFFRYGLDTREVAIWQGIVSQIDWAIRNPDKLDV